MEILRVLRVSVVQAFFCLLLVAGSSGCGYVLVKVTAPPLTPTPTGQVQLIVPSSQATATPIPAPPLPTPTPTATPTPIVYVVQKGDNLLAIAYQYDVSVQALIEVNEIADPRALQVGQSLIIPRDPDALLAAQPTATPTPMPLKIVNLAFHRTPVNSLWCMGEVQNERDESLELVQLQVTLYNADGERVDEAAGFAATDIVPGHGKAPFALLLPHPPAVGFANSEVVVLSAEPITHWGRRHRALVVEGTEWEVTEDALLIQGSVHNEGRADATEVQVTVTAYGSDGEVVGVRQVDVGPLAAGGRGTFSLSLIPAAPALRAEAVAWGMKETP